MGSLRDIVAEDAAQVFFDDEGITEMVPYREDPSDTTGTEYPAIVQRTEENETVDGQQIKVPVIYVRFLKSDLPDPDGRSAEVLLKRRADEGAEWRTVAEIRDRSRTGQWLMIVR